jgi:flagellar biosynthesis protein FliP
MLRQGRHHMLPARKLAVASAGAFLLGAVPAVAAEQTSLWGVTLNGNSKEASVPLQILLILSALTLLPAVLMCITPFLRITVVLHFLRTALGTQSTPSSQVLIGLSLFLTTLVMKPVLDQIYSSSWQPLEQGKITTQQALTEASKPLKGYMLKFARERDIRLFIELAKAPKPASPADLSLSTLIPAYIISELRSSFQIGAVLYLPFLVVDLVIASVTLTVGMVQLPPAMISAPFKILLFVIADGWNLVIGSLVKSFG